MDRLDARDKLPSGLSEYNSAYGNHFSKKMCEWAVSRMKKKNDSGQMVAIEPYSNEEAHQLLKKFNITIEHDVAYDLCYVLNMGKADFLGKAFGNEQVLAMWVKCYMDDPDGNPTRAFDEFLANCVGLGVPIMWEDVI